MTDNANPVFKPKLRRPRRGTKRRPFKVNRYTWGRGLHWRAFLPMGTVSNPEVVKAKGEALVEEIRRIEEDLSAWEAANPEKHRLLPWFEAREAYKAAKARGEVPELTWYEALWWLETQAKPKGIASKGFWGGEWRNAKRRAGRKEWESRRKARKVEES